MIVILHLLNQMVPGQKNQIHQLMLLPVFPIMETQIAQMKMLHLSSLHRQHKQHALGVVAPSVGTGPNALASSLDKPLQPTGATSLTSSSATEMHSLEMKIGTSGTIHVTQNQSAESLII